MEDEIKNDQEQKEEKQEKAQSEKPLDKMTAKELREIALEIPGISGVHAMKKEHLLQAIKEARGIREEEPPKKRKKKAAKAEVSVKDLKKKIAELKKEKEEARLKRDKRKVDVLRRRINRMKKRTKKAAQA